MDGDERSSRQFPEPAQPRRKTKRVLDGDFASLTSLKRDLLLERIDAEIAEIDDRDGSGIVESS